jgi:epsilon-lactone hydrolase
VTATLSHVGPGPDDRSRRLVAALKRHAPTPEWTIAHHREVFEGAAASRDSEIQMARQTLQTPGGLAEWLLPLPGVPRRAKTLLYLHGGGYVMGSLSTIRPLAAQFMEATDADVLTLDYRLAPEDPFPAAVEDALAAYEWLLADGHDPCHVALVGDSAGGGLVISCLLMARDRGLPMPLGGVCISPWLDMTLSAPSVKQNEDKDPQTPKWLLSEMADHYLAGEDPRNPLASPMFAELSGLPPLLLQVGGDEALLDDSVRLHERAQSAGVDVTLELWRGMPHVWHAFSPRLEQGTLAIRAASDWLRHRGL